MAARDDRKGFKLWLSSAEAGVLEVRAAARGVAPGSLARQLVLTALGVAEPSVAPGRMRRRSAVVDSRPAVGRTTSGSVASSEVGESERAGGVVDPVVAAEVELTAVKAAPMRPGETRVQRNLRIADARRALEVASRRA